MTNRLIGATLWGAAVVVAVGAGGAAVAAASSGGGRHVLTQADVDRQVRALPAVSPGPGTPSPRTTPAPVGPQAAQSLRVVGGTIVVACSGNTITLVRWAPATGYRADDPRTGPGDVASIRFESDTSTDVTVTVRCVAGKAVSDSKIEVDDHGKGPIQATPAPSETAGPTPSEAPDDHGKGGHGKDDPSPHH